MRRFQFPNAALLAGLAVLLSGCAGETPTAPGSATPPGGVPPGSCTTLISLSATTDNPFAGSGSIVRATVTRAGVPVADGGSVQFTTTLGYFGENGLSTISKTTGGGVADVTVLSTSSGQAQIIAIYDCARAQKNLQFQGVPDVGPFITSYLPTNGSCAGGDVVTINGVRLGNGTNVRVFFGGIEGSVAPGGTNTRITVTTPARTLANPSVPESVPVVVLVNSVSSPPAAVLFTYACIPDSQKMSVSSIAPIAGSPAGGDLVLILGRSFGTTIATTRVTFCGRSAQIVSLQDQLITVSTPTHILKDPAVSEACDVVVTRDIGLVSQQTATAPKQFIYSGTGGNAVCNTDPSFFITSISPNNGGPDGGVSVTITGSGFGTNPALLRVDFGGIPATILGGVSNTSFVVSSPRRTLASPDVPETVDVTVTDLGSVAQRCSRFSNGFVYTRVILTPQIFSTSPKTGPNDASTRVTIFGDGFQFPMQVFMTGANCGAQLVEAAVSDIALTTIVFKTPVATSNTCLLNQLVDIVIKNPSTNKSASIPAAFKYYACPTVGNAVPNVASGTVATTVVISGSNFEEPVSATFSAGGTLVGLAVSSVSSNAVVVTMPPISTIFGGSPICANVGGIISLTFPSLSCSGIDVPFTYRIDPPVATTASPNNLNQDGSAFPGPLGTPVSVTVLGSNFTNPMTVQLIKDGVVVANTPINNATVANPTSLTFSAPAVLNSSLNQQNCLLGGTVDGLKYVPTSFGIRLKSASTGCTVDLPNVLVYNPIDTTCRAALAITTPSLPAGTATVAYGPVTMTAVGGTGVGYSWTAAGLPGALVMSAGGTISGIPAAAGTFTVTVTVVDSATNTTSRVYSLVVN